MAIPSTKRFAYYDRLSADEQRTYRKSDAIGRVALNQPDAIRPLIAPLRAALESGAVAAVQKATGRLARALLADLAVPPADIEVLESRPRGDYGELHGLYTYDESEPPRIQVWMRTAAKGKVVAWRSYLRTLLHEIGHHLDLNHLDLADTFHTQGFYRRENDLFNQLAAGEPPPPPPKGQLEIPGL